MGFQVKFRSRRIADAARSVFVKVSQQCNKRETKDGTRQLGAVFCQLREVDLILLEDERTDKLELSGEYLPPKWATRLNRLLRRYHEEQERERGN